MKNLISRLVTDAGCPHPTADAVVPALPSCPGPSLTALPSGPRCALSVVISLCPRSSLEHAQWEVCSLSHGESLKQAQQLAVTGEEHRSTALDSRCLEEGRK